MSILPNERQYLPGNMPVDGCKCHCHYTPGVVHFMACCGSGPLGTFKTRTAELAALTTGETSPVRGEG